MKEEYTKLADAFFHLKDYEKAIKYYELGNPNYYNLGICYDKLEQYRKAIDCYEKVENKDYLIYGNLARCYTEIYRFEHREEQINYINKSYELKKDEPITLINKLLIYCKFNLPEAEQVWEELLPYNPNYSIKFSYGSYLIRNKKFKEGFRLYRHRVEHKPEALPDGLHDIWNPGIDVHKHKILISYEQGFGDTLMFIRFLPYLDFEFKLLVQDDLYTLLKDLPYEVYRASDRDMVDYEYFIPIMDLPLFLDLNPDKLPGKAGYLDLNYERSKNKKFKIGICYKGAEEAVATCRDVTVDLFKPLLDLDVELYSFQYGVTEPEPIISLGTTFRNWKDTAIAMQEMDLIISTDNGVMNLAGALGMPTFGLFNKYPEFRWFKMDEDVGWYNIKPFQCKELNGWEETMSRVVEEVKKKVDIFYK